MQIILNGEAFETESAATLLDLLRLLEIADRRVAVLVNDEIIRKNRHGDTQLAPGNKVEIIQMVGGG